MILIDSSFTTKPTKKEVKRTKIGRGNLTTTLNKERTKKRRKRMKKMTFVTFLVMALFTLFCVQPAVATEPECPGGDCSPVSGVGDVWLDVTQYQHVFPDFQDGHNAYSSGEGWQEIYGIGHGGPGTSVLAEGDHAQYDTYDNFFDMDHGEAGHFGDAYMQQYGFAETGPDCQYLEITMDNYRANCTRTFTDENTMDAGMSLSGYVSSLVVGVNPVFYVNQDQIHGYGNYRDDGSWQEGSARTNIISSSIPD